MAIIAGATNGFGYRHRLITATSIGKARCADGYDATVTGWGVPSPGQRRATSFSFVTSAGTVSFSVKRADYGAMLDSTIKLVDMAGNVIASSDTANLGEESLTAESARASLSP